MKTETRLQEHDTTKKILIAHDTYEKLQVRAKECGLSIDRYVTQLIDERAEIEEVTVKVPAKWLRMLEAEHFFGFSRERFFANAVKQAISIQLSDLDVADAEIIEKKWKFAKDEFMFDLLDRGHD